MSFSTPPHSPDYPIDLEQLLADGFDIKIKPQGFSMYPLFFPGRDEACIRKSTLAELHRGDVALYRRDSGILVLHRIWKSDETSFYMVGDNQTEIEGPLRPDQIRGKLISFVRNGRSISVSNPLYQLLSTIWLLLRPLRPYFWKFTAFLRSRRRTVK